MATVAGVLSKRFLGTAVSTAAGFAIGGAISPTLQPYTQSVANFAWNAHQSRPLTAAQAAALAVRGLAPPGEAADEATFTGYNQHRFNLLQRLAADAPTFDQLLDLRRRGVIGDGALREGIAALGILPEWRDEVVALVDVKASLTDMVEMAVHEVFSPVQRTALQLDAEFPDEFADRAKEIGVSEQLARDYWANHWKLPSFEQLAQMLFRTDMSEAQFNAALKAIDIAPVWRERYQEIARLIPTREDMVRFAVREAYSDAQAASLGLDSDYPDLLTGELAKHGIRPDDAKRYWRAHWRLPSARQGADMLARHEINDAEYDALLKALDYPAPWRPRLAAIAHIELGRIDIKRAFKLGLLNRAQVKEHYRRIRYTESDAEMMTQIAEAEAASGPEAAPWLDRARSRLFTVVHNEFVQGSMSATRARNLFPAIGIPPAQRDDVIAVWTAERDGTRKELTPSQIIKLYGKGKLTREDAFDRLIDARFTPDDANLRLDNAV